MTSILALATVLYGAPMQGKTVELARKFTAGEKLSYFARAELTDESRAGSLQVMLPQDEEISYHYTLHVQKVKADGIAEVLYQRPSMKITLGDTAEEAAKSKEEKLNWKIQLDVSPTNNITNQKDLSPPKPKGSGDFRKLPVVQKIMRQGSYSDRVAIAMLFEYKDEIQRLAFFVGSLDTGLDIAPKFSFDDVSVGSTWKSTVGYTPQKLKGGGEKQAVQRIDYTYTYMGPMKSSEGKDIIRIQAKTKVETDLIDYARQVVGGSSSSSFLKSVPLGFEATINFDLDPANLHTLKVTANSSGHFEINPKGADQALLEDKFRGKTTIKREGYAIVPVTPATAAPASGKSGKKGGLRV